MASPSPRWSCVTVAAPGRGQHPRRQGHRHAQLRPHAFERNQAWLELPLIAQDLLTWIKRICLNGQLAKAGPKRLRHLHTAGQIVRHGRPSLPQNQLSEAQTRADRQPVSQTDLDNYLSPDLTSPRQSSGHDHCDTGHRG
jgi:hypothetical protein